MTVIPTNPSDPADPPVDPTTDPVDPDPALEPKRVITQEEVDRRNRKARLDGQKEGEKAAAQAFADRLGMPVEEAAKQLQALKAKQDEEKTELERLRDQIEADKRTSEADTSKLQRENHTNAVKLQLSRANLALPEDEGEADKALDRVVGLVSVEVGASVEDIKLNIAELKEQFPSLFKAPVEPEVPKGNPSSTVAGVPRKATPSGQSPLDRAREKAAKSNAGRGVNPPTA